MEKFGLLSCLLLVLYASANASIPGLVKDFVHIEKKLTWAEARKYCQNNVEDLYLFSDQNDLGSLNTSANQLSWFGMFGSTPIWKWIDGTVASYFNWFGDCASIRKNGWWFSMSCNTKISFVCNKISGGWILVKINNTWQEAKLYCDTYHAGLALIRNSTDNTNIRAVLETDPYYWIGLATVTEYTPLNDSWRWVNNEPLTYSNWYTPLFCTVMDWRGFWHDRVCFEKNPFVCFRQNNNILVYNLVNENKNFTEAQSHCNLLKMNLVMVKSQEENIALLRQININSNLYFWIGLKNSPWWKLLGSLAPLIIWNQLQPDGKDYKNQTIPDTTINSCLALQNGEWYDEPCTDPHPFFCTTTVRSMILVSEPKSWEEALDYCRGRYVDLVSLVSDAEQQVAARKIHGDQNGYVWTGLRFLAGSWFWVYGDSLKYESWLDNGQKQCPGTKRCGALGVASGRWEPRSCEEKLNFLCFQK